MEQVDKIAAKIHAAWATERLTIRVVGPESTADLCRKFRRIPGSYLTFLRHAGIPTTDDSNGFRFWHPSEIGRASTVLAAAGYTMLDPTDSLIIFADYMQESWWYGLWTVGPHAGLVAIIEGCGGIEFADRQPAIGTLSEFLELYLLDDIRLYPER